MAVTFSLVLVVVTGCGTAGTPHTETSKSNDTLVIGSKNFTEQYIMANMMKLLIEHDTKLQVKMNTGLDSNVCWNALQEGKIDTYVEYTGTGLINILKQSPEFDPQKAYDTVSKQFETKYNITWLKPIGFNNTYAMAMRKDDAQKLGITTNSELAKQSGNLVFATGQEFLTRKDTYPTLQKVYGMHFKDIKTLATGLAYQAILEKKAEVIDVFTTDGKIPSSNLTLLKDDKHVFAPYYAVPIIRDSVLKAHPEIKESLNKLAGKIDDSQMQKLNEQVDIQHKNAMEVSKQWLKEHGLI